MGIYEIVRFLQDLGPFTALILFAIAIHELVVRTRERKEKRRGDQDCYLSSKEVVVAEADLIRGRCVVFVDPW